VNTALKEWAVVIEALARGRQRFLLRKGGIAEGRRGFEVKHSEFLLYPTWEHQQLESIRPEFRDLFEQARPRAGGVVRFQYLARVSDVLRAPARPEDLGALDGETIWAPSYVEKRYGYRPDLPLFLIIPRLYGLAMEGEIPEIRRYAGCRSWVDLEQEIDTTGCQPVEPEATFSASRKSLLEKLFNHGASADAAAGTGLGAAANPR
jgi:hypothetical protein